MRKTTHGGLLPVLALVAATMPAAADIDTGAEILRCAAVTDSGQRLQCYDALGRQVGMASAPDADSPTVAAAGPPASAQAAMASAPVVAAAPAAAAEPAAAATPGAAAVPDAAAEAPRHGAVGGTPSATLPDELGGGDFAPESEQENDSARGRVTSCKKGPDSKWYFYFEGGQVWKQVNLERLRLADCDFDAVITKDLAGYKMKIDGRQDLIRVTRKK